MYKPHFFPQNWSQKSRVQLIHGYIPESYENLFGGSDSKDLWLLIINIDYIKCSREEQ